MYTLMLNNVWLCHYAGADMGEKESSHGGIFLCFGFSKLTMKMNLMFHRCIDA